MATLYTDLTGSTTTPKNLGDGRKYNGGAGIIKATYTMSGSEAVGDIINIAKVPSGTAILAQASSVESDGAATTLTIDIGTETSATVLATALDVAADAAADAFDGTNYITTAEENITALIKTGLASPVAAKTLTFLILVKMP